MRLHAVGMMALLLMLARLATADEGGADPVDRSTIAPFRGEDEVNRLAKLVDRRLAEKYGEAGIEPAKPATDAEFLRRVTLDIAGRIPSVAEARAFLDDPSPGKRREWVERLLNSPGYASHFTDIWRGLLVPDLDSEFTLRYFAPGLETWLNRKFAEGTPYDAMVREILTTPLGEGRTPSPLPYLEGAKPSPLAFYAANDAKPENLAASTSRVFLGVRLECAQCHDHPFASWKRDQFWSTAAFFAGVDRPKQVDCDFFQARELTGRRELAVSGGSKIVPARFLDGHDPAWRSNSRPRELLANWVVSRDNPYFDHATVNRVWSLFFGIGIVDPVDDLGDHNPPSHPELLSELASSFSAQRRDFRFLIRVLTSTRAYQATSEGYVADSDAARLFASRPARGMTSEQLYSSFLQASGLKRDKTMAYNGIESPKRAFLEAFQGQDGRPLDRRTSIRQSLILMNGRLSTDATDLALGSTLPAVADAYFLDSAGKIEALFLATLTRRPTEAELDRLIPFIDRGGPTLDPKKALADVFWSLLNSSEFILNH